MSVSKFITFFVLLLMSIALWAKDIDGKPERTPEQEAAKQTETMQRELDLTPEQVARIQDINLKYAKERLQSNQRAEAMERMKNKNEEYRKVLTVNQYEHLQSKRVERRTKPMETSTTNRIAETSQPSHSQRSTGVRTQEPSKRPVTTTPNHPDNTNSRREMAAPRSNTSSQTPPNSRSNPPRQPQPQPQSHPQPSRR